MNLAEFFVMCKKLKWEELYSFLHSDVSDLSTKILVCALIEQHHPDPIIANKYGLKESWGKKLSSEPVNKMFLLYTSAVDLSDFAGAYILAESKDLDDTKVAASIKKFVDINKVQLSPYLDSDQAPQNLKIAIKNCFPAILVSKKEKEAYYQRQFTQQAVNKIAYLQAIDQVITDLASIFQLRTSEFKLCINQNSNIRGVEVESIASEGTIYFKDIVPDKVIAQCAKILLSLNISSDYFNVSYWEHEFRRGIQLQESPIELHRKLTSFMEFLNDTSFKNEIHNENTQRFFTSVNKLNKLKILIEKSRSETLTHKTTKI